MQKAAMKAWYLMASGETSKKRKEILERTELFVY